MNKRMICAALAALCLLLCAAALAQGDYQAVNMPLKVNNAWYRGASPVRDAEGTLYFPLNDLSAALDIQTNSEIGGGVKRI